MTNPTPYWQEPAWRRKHGFDSIDPRPVRKRCRKGAAFMRDTKSTWKLTGLRRELRLSRSIDLELSR